MKNCGRIFCYNIYNHIVTNAYLIMVNKEVIKILTLNIFLFNKICIKNGSKYNNIIVHPVINSKSVFPNIPEYNNTTSALCMMQNRLMIW